MVMFFLIDFVFWRVLVVLVGGGGGVGFLVSFL